MKKLKIYHINIRSLNKNFSSLYNFIFETEPDIVCLTEIWQINDNSNVHINGYNFEFVSRIAKRGGGVGMYIREGITYSLIKITNKHIENLFIKFQAGGKKHIVGCIYRPPNFEIDVFLCNTREVLNNKLLNLEKSNVFILGDFNIDFKSPNSKQVRLHNLFSEFCFRQIIQDATRVTESSSTLIDLIFTNIETHLYVPVLINEKITDHYLTGIIVDLKIRKVARTINFRPTHKIDIENFTRQLKIAHQPTQNFDSFHETFVQTLDKLCPKVSSKSKKPFAPWMLTKEVQETIKAKKSLLRICRKNPSDETSKQLLRDKQRQQQRLVQYYRNNYLSNTAKNCDTKTLWRTIHLLNHSHSKNTTIDCNIFNKFYVENAFNLTDHVPTDTTTIHNFILSSTENSHPFFFQAISIIDIEKHIHSMKNNKTDLNGIDSNLIKKASTILCPILQYYINISIQSSVFPSSLKRSKLIPVPKTSVQSNNPTDHRPIAIQPTFSKIFEKVLLDQINGYLRQYHIISEQQFGFRHGKSTEQLLHLLYNSICSNLNKGFLSIVISLDMSKAFDTLDHLKLIEKLERIGFSKSALNLILSYLRNRIVITSSNHSLSLPSDVLSGVPQGSILGPTLFNIYINNFIQSFPNAKVFQYADDCQILLSFNKEVSFQSIISKIEDIIQIAENWCKENYLCLNKSKTQILPIFNKNSVFSRMPFNLSSPLSSNSSNISSINFISHCKILGVYFNNKLSWFDHFYQQNKLIQKSFYSFRLLFTRYTPKHDTSLRFSILIKALMPKITYSISLFHTHNTFCNKIWLSWNRRISSLILRKYARTEDSQKLHLLSLEEWTKIRLITLAHSFIKSSSTFLNLQLKQSQIHLRSTHTISTTETTKSTEYQLVVVWNSLPNKTKANLLSLKKLHLKHFRNLNVII